MPLLTPKELSPLPLVRSGNSAEREAQADRVLTRAVKNHVPRAERRTTVRAYSFRRRKDDR